MNFEKLEWDSNFLKFNVAKVSLKITDVDINEIIEKAKKQKIKLIYFFINPDNKYFIKKIINEKGLLVDEKITFSQSILNDEITFIDSNIELYKDNKITKELIDIAIQTAEFSRFRVDKNFDEDLYKKMYTIWIENSIYKKMANTIYVYKIKNKINGLITLKDKKHTGTISLIGVNNTERGKNIGSKMIKTAIIYYKNKNIKEIEVVTQKANKLACKFYEKNNFSIKSVQNIYHLWL